MPIPLTARTMNEFEALLLGTGAFDGQREGLLAGPHPAILRMVMTINEQGASLEIGALRDSQAECG